LINTVIINELGYKIDRDDLLAAVEETIRSKGVKERTEIVISLVDEAEMKKIGVNPRNKEASLYKIHVKYSNHDLRRIQGLFSASRRTPQEVIEHALHIQSGVASALKYDYEFWINCQGTFNINDKISVAEYL